MLPASDASAPLGIRTTIGGMCSKESGIESSSTFIRVSWGQTPSYLKPRENEHPRMRASRALYELLAAHITPQRLRNHHRPVLPLVVFQNRHERPADRKARAVQCVRVLG